MRTFDVQSIELGAPVADAFRYLAHPATLPEWTHAFSEADEHRATLSTPHGAVTVGLRVAASGGHGTIEWTMTFPDGAVARASSRLVAHRGRCIYTFATAFRKRLSRAREAIIEFTRAHCGLVEQEAACRCIRRLPRAQAIGRIDGAALLFARSDSARAFPSLIERVRRLESVRRTAALYRATPDADPGPELLERIQAAVDTD